MNNMAESLRGAAGCLDELIEGENAGQTPLIIAAGGCVIMTMVPLSIWANSENAIRNYLTPLWNELRLKARTCGEHDHAI